ncbi:MAG: efflux RND transporter periplasmic adaptor subunit [Rhodospirillaceae bacterium]
MDHHISQDGPKLQSEGVLPSDSTPLGSDPAKGSAHAPRSRRHLFIPLGLALLVAGGLGTVLVQNPDLLAGDLDPLGQGQAVLEAQSTAQQVDRPVGPVAPLAEDASAPLMVETVTVRIAEGYSRIEAHSGRLEARRQSALAFERQGRLDDVMVDVGDPVQAGQVLARLDRRSLQSLEAQQMASLDAAKARVAALEARKELAELTTERREALVSRQAVSRQAFDESRLEAQALGADLAEAQAGVAQAEAALQAVQVDLDLAELRAPYDGTVLARHVDEGSTVSPGAVVLDIQESGTLEARIGLPPEQAGLLSTGDQVLLRRAMDDPLSPGEGAGDAVASGVGLAATVRRLVDAVDRETRTVDVVLDVNADAKSAGRPGDVVYLSVDRWQGEPGFWVPLSALKAGRRGLWTAYALDQAAANAEPGSETTIGRREVEILHTDGARVFVRGAIRDGDQLVARGLHRLVPGQVVRTAPVLSQLDLPVNANRGAEQ